MPSLLGVRLDACCVGAAVVFGAEQEAVEKMLSAALIALIAQRVSAAWVQVQAGH